MPQESRISELLRQHEQEVLTSWVRLQEQNLSMHNNLLKAGELEEQCRTFLRALIAALAEGGGEIATGPTYGRTREILSDISRARARQGFTPTETATFVFSLKQPVFDMLRREV
jgi:rsbT co-antagonist protein RsbR